MSNKNNPEQSPQTAEEWLKYRETHILESSDKLFNMPLDKFESIAEEFKKTHSFCTINVDAYEDSSGFCYLLGYKQVTKAEGLAEMSRYREDLHGFLMGRDA